MFRNFQKTLFRRTFIVLNVFILLFVATVQFKAEAANSNFAYGELEAGAIMQWGGTALLAAAGNATSIDPVIMEQVHQFGQQAWQDADTSTKLEITSSIQGYGDLWGTNRKYSLQWSSDAQIYLVKKWNEYFGAGALINASNNKIDTVATINSVIMNSIADARMADTGFYRDLGFIKNAFGKDIFLRGVQIDYHGAININFNEPYTIPSDSPLLKKKFPNALVAYREAVKELGIKPTYQTVQPRFGLHQHPYTRYEPLAFPEEFPTRLTLPALKGIVNNQGVITTLEKPNIGRVGNSLTGEIAISYPTYIGDTGTFTKADSVTQAPPEEPVNGGGNGNGEGSYNDTPTYSPLDLIVYKAMVQFIQEYRINHSNNLDQLLEYMKLNDSGKPSNKQVWNEWLGSFTK
ncbi:hypothetical protein CXK86_13730 [Paenibacillus sp. BGI2013]|uniref:hypothetical protein n=1 Tax=Paenibacillus TaxID=44249 RepID=UPI00096F5977|nr:MULTISPECIES: hypothetical protein [Paenibacillus]OMF46401.1 hypothetical protein BK136_07170 [Paenibacillus amylolyticus]PKQ91071.1 hypothetical protein CXK86_13730 [Paenibacillus sp. BGI2013]